MAAGEARFRDRVHALGGTVLGIYRGVSEPVLIRCGQGHEVSPKPSTIPTRGLSCPGCYVLRKAARGEEKFRTRIAELGGVVIGPYVDTRTPVLIRCAQGHEVTPTPANAVRGSGICRSCSGHDQVTPEKRFRDRVQALGGVVIGPYVDTRTPVLVRCARGHEVAPRPSNVGQGNGICRKCIGLMWDSFYVVRGPSGVKFGVTSGDFRNRLADHRRDGYHEVLRVFSGLPGGGAYSLERELIQVLSLSSARPVKGREYYGDGAANVILTFVDEWMSCPVGPLQKPG